MKLKERKRIANGFRRLQEAFEQEDVELLHAQETQSRASKKREEKAKRQTEAVARRTVARLLSEKEEKDLEKPKKKLTAGELLIQREKDLREREKIMEENERKQRHIVTEKEYENIVSVENLNRRYDDDLVDTDTIEEAIHVMTTLELSKI